MAAAAASGGGGGGGGSGGERGGGRGGRGALTQGVRQYQAALEAQKNKVGGGGYKRQSLNYRKK